MGHRNRVYRVVFRLLVLLLSSSAGAGADQLQISDLGVLPGDDIPDLATSTQQRPVIAAGGPGALVVWEDTRTVLSTLLQTPFAPLMGNSQDIVAARIDGTGQPVDTAPIVVSNRGRIQQKPEVAWNPAAGAWLVTWMSERPDWHYFEDVMAARVAADGTVLDPEPVPIRLDSNALGDTGGETPAVASNGSEWLIVWQDSTWTGSEAHPNVSGQRIAADGTLLGSPVVLHQHDAVAFGPRQPRVAVSGDTWLVIWYESGSNKQRGLRFDASLTPLDTTPLDIVTSPWGRVAGNDDGFLVVGGNYRAYRISAGGQLLDPAGIDIGTGYPYGVSGPEVAHDGLDWTVTYAAADTANFQDDPDIYLARIASDGTVQSPGAGPLLAGSLWEFSPAVAAGGQPGEALIAFATERPADPILSDVRALTVDVTDTVGSTSGLSHGLPRQWAVRTAPSPTAHLAVFVLETSGATSIVARMIGSDGQPLDSSSVEVVRLPEGSRPFPEVAFDGERFLVVWIFDGTVWGSRLDVDGNLVDPSPVSLIAGDNAQFATVGALPGTFLVGWIHLFSGDLQTFRTAPVAGNDLTLVGTPTTVGSNFSTRARIRGLGNRFLAIWQRQPTHNQGPPAAYGSFIDSAGTPAGTFNVNVAGAANDLDLAVGDGLALAVWADGGTEGGLAVEGRLIAADGSMPGGEILIADAANHQRFPAAGWDGANFVVSWVDYRSLTANDQLRGDIWARRVTPDGVPVEATGLQLTSGPLPEELPAVASAGGRSLVLYSALNGVGGVPEVPRLARHLLTDPAVTADSVLFTDDFESGGIGRWSSVVP